MTDIPQQPLAAPGRNRNVALVLVVLVAGMVGLKLNSPV